jgi:hypothetical protein
MGIEEIRQRKNEGKKKWGIFLVAFIKQSFDENTPYDFIVKELNDKYQIDLSTHELTNLIYSVNKKNKNKKTLGTGVVQILKKPVNNTEKVEESKIVLNEEKETNHNNDLLDLFDKTGTQKQPIEKSKSNPFKK